MVKTSDPLKQETLSIVVDTYKDEMRTINEAIHQIDFDSNFIIAEVITNKISVYKNN